MIKVNEKLTILHDNNSSFADYSNNLASYDRGTASFTYIAAEDKIYVGFEKPISTFYVEFSTANTNDLDLSVSYYNGTSFTAVSGYHDDTNGFQRSGFIRWDRNQTTEAKTTINSTETYWYQLALSGDSTAMIIKGINIVFSDDQDLKREIFEIDKYLPSGESTHILSHAAARDEIIQQLRADGRHKEDIATGRLKDITSFDLLDISQVKMASTYLTLAKIFMAASDEVDDIYMTKSSMFRSLYNKAMMTMYLNVDEDNDGISDYEEELHQNSPQLVRR